MTRLFVDLPRVSTTALNPRVPQKLGYPFSHHLYQSSDHFSLSSIEGRRWFCGGDAATMDNGARFTQANDDGSTSG
ncbi:hypothetical protein HanXRQr2_Chr15g0697231 [Helianthus annuus]|uniref:Uncharacterized protein n=1 Tax=Helianthus annuus TaxID=4232 RepID=A0A9K3E2K5_HELAN|nr:hypothetical protein HanXRQr2_Chr15g0697231 [Helianthus annuus]KAJ0831610.1 hypothetical protein HanPSC8_Chr15g0669001 [Helianthus annuus]